MKVSFCAGRTRRALAASFHRPTAKQGVRREELSHRSVQDKALVARNAWKGGIRAMLRELSCELRKQQETLDGQESCRPRRFR